MAAKLALLFVIIELAAVIGGLALPSGKPYYRLAVYGSPIHLFMYLTGAHAVLLATTRQYLYLLLFHVVKYAFFIKGKIDDIYDGTLVVALIGEALYLGYCGYTLYR